RQAVAATGSFLGGHLRESLAELDGLVPSNVFHRVIRTAAIRRIEKLAVIPVVVLAALSGLPHQLFILALRDLVDAHVERLGDGDLVLRLVFVALLLVSR